MRKTKAVKEIHNYHPLLRNQKTKLRTYDFFNRWKDLLGTELSKGTKPIKVIKTTTLIIGVESSARAQECECQKDFILEKIQMDESGMFIKNIRFQTMDPREIV